MNNTPNNTRRIENEGQSTRYRYVILFDMQVTVLSNLLDYILSFFFPNMEFFVLKLLKMKRLKFAPPFNRWGLYATPIIANTNNS